MVDLSKLSVMRYVSLPTITLPVHNSARVQHAIPVSHSLSRGHQYDWPPV
jgi:hypothetical protein